MPDLDRCLAIVGVADAEDADGRDDETVPERMSLGGELRVAPVEDAVRATERGAGEGGLELIATTGPERGIERRVVAGTRRLD